MKGAELSIIRSARNEKCPFCDQTVAKTRKEFGHHVGKHMMKTSLACLPSFGNLAGHGDQIEQFQDSIQEDNHPSFGNSSFPGYRGMLRTLTSCWEEAQRVDIASKKLIELRSKLPEEEVESITAIIRENESLSRILRDLYDLFPIYISMLPVVLYYLDVVLPAVSAVSGIILQNHNHPDKPVLEIWESLLADLNITRMSPQAEFMMYVEFLVQLVRLFSRYGYNLVSTAQTE
jgi:hypothetical protein